MKAATRILTALALVFGLTSAHAISGQVDVVTVAGAGNYPFRVSFVGVSTAFCTGGQAWGYLDTTDSNYGVFVAALVQAKNLGSTVGLTTTNVGGYCKITYATVQ